MNEVLEVSLDVLHALVLDDGRRWGKAATGWQQGDAAKVLDPGCPTRLHFLTRPKGGSKSTDLAAIVIVWLLCQAHPLDEAVAVAADEEQANRLLDKARGLIARTPELRGRLRVEARRIVNVGNGARCVALAADVASSEGLLTPLVIVDELPNWPSTKSARGMWTSVLSALPKVPTMRLVVIGHASDPSHWSYRILEHARTSNRWRTNEVPGPLPWVRAEDLEEQRALLLPSEYARRHLNRWTEGEDRLATVDDVRSCVTHTGPLGPVVGERYIIAVDLGLTNDRTVMTVAHAEHGDEATRVIVDRQVVWQGTKADPVAVSEVEAAILQAHEQYNRAGLIVDPWQLVSTVQRLRSRGVDVVEFTFSSASIGRLATTLFRLVRDHLVGLPDDPELLSELATVRLVTTSAGGVRIDHESGAHDDRVISLALASYWLVDTAPPKPVEVPAPGGAKKVGFRTEQNRSPWW